MTKISIISWNVNGIKSTIKQGLIDFIERFDPDILCLQEIKSHYTEFDQQIPNYIPVWNPAEKKGYAGTAIFSKIEPLEIIRGINVTEHGSEGRVTTIETKDFFLTNVYTVNAQRGLTRLENRMKWDKAFLKFIKILDKKKPVIVCGDFNVAHKEIDLARPKDNKHNAGFTEEERSGFESYIQAGFVDSFREFDQSEGNYTWWSMRTKKGEPTLREKNIGWRIDYFLVSKRFMPKISNSLILKEIFGSDHCPIKLVIDLKEING